MGFGINGFHGLGKKAGFVGLGKRLMAGKKLWFGGFIGSWVLRLGEDQWVGHRGVGQIWEERWVGKKARGQRWGLNSNGFGVSVGSTMEEGSVSCKRKFPVF
ncbi:hypothetical protein FH972_012381 [Carpinus fangiana]|uniref:Uncharacterized protein n=1 Tax=Carpinus fangiana TaxID=176857 RepID=A0A5N6R6S5_9ROSI|nr:hypothetical protein FH972_012381 [Carpinus fangiana]